LRAIANEWQLSPEGARQIGERALNRLRMMKETRGLRDYLED
jgi:DNA-directed RNA polymerase sigma subunit (sigma70/sigma32)